MKTHLSSIVCFLVFICIGNKTYAQDEGSDGESEQFIIREGVAVESSTDFFESELLCLIPKGRTVTMLDSTDGEYVMIRVKCNGKEVVGWVKKQDLAPKMPNPSHEVSPSGGVDSAHLAGNAKADDITPNMPNVDLSVEAKGTGNTTGHIANLSVTNEGKKIITIFPQTAYIPSSGQYQPYVAYIPKTPVPPGTTIIPVEGFCADVQAPPVNKGDPMPLCEKWIPIGDPNLPVPDEYTPIVPVTPVLPFEPSDIPGITSSPYFHPITPEAEASIIILWPGTDLPLGGEFGKEMEPTTQAKVLVKAIEQIAESYDVIRKNNPSLTPFSGDPEKEREAVIQQTFWIYTSGLAGEKYKKEYFSENVYKQFYDQTGLPIPQVPDEQRQEVDKGIDQFWNTFTAVGVEAKVLGNKDSDPGEAVPIQHREAVKCILRDTLRQVYSRGQNDDNQLRQQANSRQDGTCMYETAQFELEWSLYSNCNCTEPNKICSGDITVNLRFLIVNLKEDHGDPTEYLLLPVQPPSVNQSTHTTNRNGAETDTIFKPGPNIRMYIPEELKIEGEHIRFVDESRISDRKLIYTAESRTTIPCAAGTYPVRFLVKKSRSKRTDEFRRNDKHKVNEQLNLFADAIITIQQNTCSMTSAMKGYAAEFRTAWDPADVPYVNEKGQSESIKVKNELPQVRLNGSNDPIYYNLLKLISENGHVVDKAFPPKERGVRIGE